MPLATDIWGTTFMPNQPVKYDSIVIGSGQGGNPLAQRLASRGERVALIESGPLGGTCVNTGCTPTKTMISSAQVAYYARNGHRWGVQTRDVRIDLPAILRRQQEIVQRSRDNWQKQIDDEENWYLYRARARFIAPKQVQAGEDVLEGKRIFIDTGGSPAIPDISGLNNVPYLTNASLLELREIPKHLVVLGGGYIGLEFGQMFHRFGSEVTIIASGERIMPKEDDDVAVELQKTLESEGLRIISHARVTRVGQNADGLSLRAQTPAGEVTIQGSHLLVAIGRIPNTKDLDLEKAGVKTTEKGFIVVNERLETTAADIWAIGDVTGGPAFTHISYNDYEIIYGNVFEGKNLSTSARIVPYSVYTDPELGRVGMTEGDARKKGYRLKIGTVEMKHVARAIERAETHGLMKLVVDARTDLVLGAAILASEGGELVQIWSMLMRAEKPYTLLKGAIYIHPTLAEGFFRLVNSVKEVD